MSPLSYFHTPLISVYKRKMKKTSLWFIKALPYFSINTKPFCFFIVISKLLRRVFVGRFQETEKSLLSFP